MPSRVKALLDNSKELAIDVVKLLDPTGITSWKDAYTAVKHIDSDPGTWVNAGIEVLGALPVVGKMGKLGKVGKLVKRTENLLSATNKTKKAVQVAKIPGKIVRNGIAIPMRVGHLVANKTFNLFKKNPKVFDVSLSGRRINNARNLIKVTKVAQDLDNVVTGGTFTKGAANFVGENSGGLASLFSGPLSFFGKALHDPRYSGFSKANDSQRAAIGNQNPLKQVLYGNGGFQKYNKPLFFNGEQLDNVYRGKIYPADSIIADRNLKGTMQPADSENMYDTDNETPVIDVNHFRIKFNNNIARSSDRWDWNPYTISGKMMTAATKPTWLYPNAGIVTFVDETPVKYSTKSDSILSTLLGK